MKGLKENRDVCRCLMAAPSLFTFHHLNACLRYMRFRLSVDIGVEDGGRYAKWKGCGGYTHVIMTTEQG